MMLTFVFGLALASSSSSSSSSSRSSWSESDHHAAKIAAHDNHRPNRDLLHDVPSPPPRCNQAYARDRYENAFLTLLNTAHHGETHALADLQGDNATLHFSLNGRDLAHPPVLGDAQGLAALGIHVAANVVDVTAQPGGVLSIHAVAAVSHGASLVTKLDAHLRVVIGKHCESMQQAIMFQSDATPEILHPLFAPPGDVCLAGEARLEVGGDCVPISCASPRACPDDACRRVRPDERGVSFACGCGVGFEMNGHTRKCVAVTCAARGACPEYSVCEMLPEGHIDDCNPTTSMAGQWVRGSKPCPKFRCVGMRAKTTEGSTTQAPMTTTMP